MTGPNSARPRPGVGYSALIGAAVVVTALLALRAGRPPEPLPRSAAGESFSAARAMDHVEVLARAPRPLGTQAHRLAMRYLEEELQALGLETEIQEATWVRGFGPGRQTAARVRNVLGRLPGRAAAAEGGDTLLLLAHYDSQPQTVGAGDDAAGIASILETLRARQGDGAPRNEIVVAFTDAEEIGLIGAAAFTELHPWFERVDRTLNFEGRGQRGAVLMFETADGGLASARDLARHAPYPAASSLSYEVYRRMPNDTDFSVIRRAGGRGLNFAFIGGLPAYHSALDTAARLDRGTLQHMGANALAMTRHYADAELGSPEPAEGVYFNPWGLAPLWVFSERVAIGAAGAALALVLGCFLYLRRRGEARWLGLLLGWGLVVVGVLVGMGLTWVCLRLLGPRPPTPYGVPYADGAAALALTLVAAAAWVLVLGLWRSGRHELLIALAGLWTVLGVASAWFVPGLSHLLLGPALLLGAGLALGLWRSNPWPVALVGSLPGVLLWAPALELSHQALTLNAALPLAGVTVLAATLLTPALVGLEARGRRVVAVVALVLGCGLGGWAIHGRGPTADRPQVNSLFLLHESESSSATWYSLDSAVDNWTAELLGAEPERAVLPEVLDARQREVLAAPASVPARQPSVTAVRERDDRPGGGRSVAIRLRSSAPSLRLRAHANVALSAASFDGRPCELDANGELRLSIHGTAPEGYLLEVEMGDRWPLYLEIVEVNYALPAVAGTRPPERIARPGWWTDTTMVQTSWTL